MKRFFLVLAAVLTVSGLTLAHLHAAALVVGIIAGSAFLLHGMAGGGNLGNARQFRQGRADVGTRIGICLAAAGIASASLGYVPAFPLPFRIFYGMCLILACFTALFLAVRSPKDG